ncbi:MAG: heparinase II/III domain-containing protein, partial [Gemmatimonadaceae bacterium]
LLMARAELPPLAPLPSRSVLLEGQGLAVLRRDGGRVYAALDYGHPGGGHGHPDRLNVILAAGDERLLDDVGTGSYVDPTLRWYRSTLAHNAPMIGGRTQPPVTGRLRAYDERGAAGWVDAVIPAGGLADGVAVSRTLVAMPDYLIDQVIWEGRDTVQLDLPLHASGEVRGVGMWRAAPLTGGDAPDDGFGFVHGARVAMLEVGAAGRLIPAAASEAWVVASVPLEWWTALAPGTPADGDQERELTLLRAHAARGSITCLWSWRQSVCDVTVNGETLVVRAADGSVHHHSRQDGGSRWHVELQTEGARSSIDLAGSRLPNDSPEPPPDGPEPPAPPSRRVGLGSPQRFHLGEQSYRRSEESWSDAGSPEATVQIAVDAEALVVDVTVRKSELTFRSEQSPDPALDNEHPDIHSDGIQLHLLAPDWPVPAAWLAVPVPGTDRARLREVAGAHRGVPLLASWARTADGYAVRLSVPLDSLGEGHEVTIALDVLVNETAPGRQRRRGQLALSGGGDFIYLQGDRRAPDRYLRFLVARA